MPSAKKVTTARATPPARRSRTAPQAARRPPPAAPEADALQAIDLREDSLGYRLRRAQMHAYSLFFEMLGPLELSPARLTALSVIASEADISQAALAQRLSVAGPSALKLIDALEGSGYIRRMAVPHDRRRHSLMLTASGRAVLQTLQQRHADYEERLASRLTPAERTQLMTLLQRLLG